jgi:hypothetical protein
MSPTMVRRVVEGFGGNWCVFDSRHRDPTNGRQGKRPAFGAAYVVGWIGQFTDITDTPCWRFCHFSQRIQRLKRRRTAESSDFCR